MIKPSNLPRATRQSSEPTTTGPVVPATRQLLDDELISFAELAARPSNRGIGNKRRFHVSTAHRWRSPGINGCRLSAVRMGGRWFTKILWFEEFCAAVTAANSGGTPQQPPNSTPAPVAAALAREGF